MSSTILARASLNSLSITFRFANEYGEKEQPDEDRGEPRRRQEMTKADVPLIVTAQVYGERVGDKSLVQPTEVERVAGGEQDQGREQRSAAHRLRHPVMEAEDKQRGMGEHRRGGDHGRVFQCREAQPLRHRHSVSTTASRAVTVAQGLPLTTVVRYSGLQRHHRNLLR